MDLLRRSDRRSVQALKAEIHAWVNNWNQNSPFIWTTTAEWILKALGRLLDRI